MRKYLFGESETVRLDELKPRIGAVIPDRRCPCHTRRSQRSYVYERAGDRFRAYLHARRADGCSISTSIDTQI